MKDHADLISSFATICRAAHAQRVREHESAQARLEQQLIEQQQQQQRVFARTPHLWQVPFVGQPQAKIRDVEVEVVDEEESKPKQLPPPDPEGR